VTRQAALSRVEPGVLEAATRALASARTPEAIDLLERALAAGADSGELRALLGRAYARTRQVDQAFHHLERAVELTPAAFAPRCALGELYLRLALDAQGREHLERARGIASTPAEHALVDRLLRGVTPTAREGRSRRTSP
jgi:tetratricopeptide (TPR) repeat protein